MNFPVGVSAVLSYLAQLYEATDHPQAQVAARGLRTEPRTYLVPDGQIPQVVEHLARSLDELPSRLRSSALIDFAANGPWREGRASFPPSFQGRSAVLELIGPDGLGVSADIRCGLYLQAPACLYPPHSHIAEEFYLVLSGPALWQRNDGTFEIKSPGALVHHEPWVRHAMRTLDQPLLAAWIWTGQDVTYRTYRID